MGDSSVRFSSEARAERDERTRRLLGEADLATSPHRRQSLREEAILLNRDLAARIARRYRFRGVEDEDLEQVAMMALCKAVTGYRPRPAASFAAYAIPTISGELRRHFRDHAWVVRPPRRLQELSALVRAAEMELSARLATTATVQQVAAHLGIAEVEVRRARQASAAFRATSLAAPIGDQRTLGEVIEDDRDEVERLVNVLVLRDALAGLPERERRVLSLRYAYDMTQADIAREVGVSQMHVSRILARTLRALRSTLVAEPTAS